MQRLIRFSTTLLLLAPPMAHAAGWLDNSGDSLSISVRSHLGHQVIQHVHPDLVYRPGWNGHDYWMMLTPYPGGDDDFENPSIVFSDDGLQWTEPANVNPVANRIPEVCSYASCYNNDPDILFVGNTLVMYYNETTAGANQSTNVMRATSTDGVSWLLDDNPVIVRPNYPLSPAVVYENNTYTMWFVMTTGPGCGQPDKPEVIIRRTSTDGINWSATEDTINLTGAPGIVPWHLDVVRDGGKLVMVFAGYPQGPNCTSMQLYYAESVNGLDWKVDPTPLIEQGAPDAWNRVVYRSTLLADQGYLRVWYSAHNGSSVWKIGYTEGQGPDLTAPAQIGLGAGAACYNHIILDWIAPGDDEGTGTAVAYDLRWRSTPFTEQNFTSSTSISIPAPQSGGSLEHHDIPVPHCSAARYYAVKARDEAGNWSPMSNVAYVKPACPKPPIFCEDLESAPGGVAELPGAIELAVPEPNPARTKVRMQFGIPPHLAGREFDLSIFDLTGRRVATLDRGESRGGLHEATWNLMGEDGSRVPQGVYFARLRIAGETVQRRIVTLP